jgi:transcriptional regulator with XRE-family HTH domain
MRLGLKAAILQRGLSQRELSKLSAIAENRLSTIIRGWTNPRPDERAAIARVLHQSESVLFDNSTTIELRSAR